MTDTSALDPAEYLRRLFDDVEFCYLVVVAAQLGVANVFARSTSATGIGTSSSFISIGSPLFRGG